MAETAKLLTKIMADNAQFKSQLKEASSAARKFHSETTSLFKEVGRGFLAAFSIGAVLSTLKATSEEIDNMAASAKKLDISTQSFQSLEYAAKRSDVEIGTLEQGIKRLRTSATQALSGNQGIIAGFQKAGISVKDLNKPVDELYRMLSEGIKGKSANQQVSIVNALFGGRQGQEQLNLLRNDLKGLNAEFDDLGGALSDLDIAKFDEMDRATDRVAQTVKRSLQNSLIALSPIITKLADGFVYMAKDFESISQRINDSIDRIKGSGYNPNAMDQFQDNGKVSTYVNYRRRVPAAKSSSIGGDIISSIDVLAKGFGALSAAAEGSTQALKALGQGTLKDLFGINDTSGKQYLSQILTKRPQAMDATFTKLVNEMKDIVEGGGNVQGVRFQSDLALAKSIAQQYGFNKDVDSSGMRNAIAAITKASDMLANPNRKEVTVIVKVKDNEFISAVVDSSKFVDSVTDVAVKAADNAARKAVR